MKNILKRPFLLIFIIIVIVNISYALIYNIKPAVDAEAYDEIALNIVNHGQYRANLTTPIEMDGSITRIGPGYEYFLAGNYMIFGRHLWIVWSIQAILFAFTILMLGSITLRLFPEINKKIIYGVMILFGIIIDIIQLNGMLMTESLFLFTLALCLYYFSNIYENNKWYSWIILGILLGTLTLIRPTGLIIFVFLSAVTLFKYKKKGLLYITLIGLMFVIVQLPWVMRNYNIFGKIIFHTTADGMNLLSGNYPGNHGEFNANFPLFKELKEKYSYPINFNSAAKSWYRNFVIEHPIQATGVLVEKATVLFSLAKTSGFWFHYFGKYDQLATILLSILQNFIILTCILVFLLTSLGKIKSRNINKKEVFILLAFLILIATPILTVIANRHRLPLTIMSLPVIVWSANYLIANYRTQYKKILLAILIIIISTSIDVYLQFDKFKSRLQRVDKIEQNA
jgi:4-amino-4-deoxy-L-arabinose transferase-like glycosyltransferase